MRPVMLFFFVYAAAVCLGTFGLLNSGCVFAFILCATGLAWKTRLFRLVKPYGCELKNAADVCPVFGFIILYAMLTALMCPGVGGDSQVYHLPSISYMIKTGSTAGFMPDFVYRPASITTYYMRGFEAVCALFYSLPGAKIWIALFKWFLFSGLYFIFFNESKNRAVAASFVVFCLSMQFVRDDLGNLKNDLALAVPLVYAASVLIQKTPSPAGLWTVPVACALALSTKSSALFYMAPLLLLWLWSYRRQFWLQLLCVAGIVLPFGLYFYWVNWIQLGNPLFPFEVTLGGWTLFPGRAGNFNQTSIVFNADATLPLMFLRGLLRASGPAGALALGSLPVLIPAVIKCREISTRWKGLALLVFWVAGFLITPFSDRNGAEVHNQLYSGHTIRFALPAVLLMLLLFSERIASWIGTSSSRAQGLIWITAAASLINFFWYDATCLLAKPENALASFAPIAQTFDLRILGLWAVASCVVCAVVIFLKRPWLAGVLVAGAVGVQQIGYPHNLMYSMRFKQIGQTSGVFDFLKSKEVGRWTSVAVYSADEASFFLACVNDYLLPRTERMHYVESLPDLDGEDWLIVCAKDDFVLNNAAQGRKYTVSWEFFDTTAVPPGYKNVYSDGMYQVYAK